jgi:hypothetical protein
MTRVVKFKLAKLLLVNDSIELHLNSTPEVHPLLFSWLLVLDNTLPGAYPEPPCGSIQYVLSPHAEISDHANPTAQ